jgi:hypothetical protein
MATPNPFRNPVLTPGFSGRGASQSTLAPQGQPSLAWTPQSRPASRPGYNTYFIRSPGMPAEQGTPPATAYRYGSYPAPGSANPVRPAPVANPFGGPAVTPRSGYASVPSYVNRSTPGPSAGPSSGVPTGTARPGGLYAQIVDGGIIGAPDHDRSMTDWFAPGGSPVKTPVSGTVLQSANSFFGSVGMLIRGDDGSMWEMRHVHGTVRPGQHVMAGQVVATIRDDSLPGSYQHVSVTRNGVGATPFLMQNGARAQTQPTSGPSQGPGWETRGPLGGGGGFGGGGFGGFGGPPNPFGGPPNPFGGPSPFGGFGGFPPFGPIGPPNPFSMFPGGLPGNPFTMGFGGFGRY